MKRFNLCLIVIGLICSSFSASICWGGVSCSGFTCDGTAAFSPNVPSAANGDVSYVYEFRGWTKGYAACSDGPERLAEFYLLTTESGTAGNAIVAGRGDGEYFSVMDWWCGNHVEYHCQQTCTWVGQSSCVPDSLEDPCYGTYNYIANILDWTDFFNCINTKTDISRGYDSNGNMIWEYKYTYPTDPFPCYLSSNSNDDGPCSGLSGGLLCDDVYHFFGWSGYYKLEAWVKQGVTPPAPPTSPNPVDPTLGGGDGGGGGGGGMCVPPVVYLISPISGSIYVKNTQVEINALASDVDGVITSVKFYDGTTLLYTDTQAPFSYTWDTSSASIGAHSLTATATDNCGKQAVSKPVSVTLVQSGVHPTVSLTSPANNSKICQGQNVTLSANASDDGSVARVEFYRGAVLIGVDYSAPYSIPWNYAPAGIHQITARAVDNSGLATVSTAVTITVAGLDANFSPNVDDEITDVTLRSNGEIVIVGSFSQISGVYRDRIAKLGSNGFVNSQFNPTSTASTLFNDGVYCVAIDAANRVYVGGSYCETDYPFGCGGRLVRLNPLGGIDKKVGTTEDFIFDYDGTVWVFGGGGYEINSTGTLTVGGAFDLGGNYSRGIQDVGIGVWGSDGWIDTVYTGVGANSAAVLALARTTNGIVAGGDLWSSYSENSVFDLGVLWAERDYYNNNLTFSGGVDGYVYALATQADGKILAGGSFSSLGNLNWWSIGRFDSSGQPDAGFVGAYWDTVYAILVQADGKIIIGGSFGIARLNTDGSTDSTFCGSVNGTVRKLVKQPDGKVIAVGSFSQFSGQTRNNIARFTP